MSAPRKSGSVRASGAFGPIDSRWAIRHARAGGQLVARAGRTERLERVEFVARDDFWIEIPFRDEWILAFRLAVQDGRSTLAELRLFPAESDINRPPGLWSGEVLGIKARAPRGGITSTLLRKVRVAACRVAVQDFIGKIRAKHGDAAFSSDSVVGAVLTAGRANKRRPGTRPGRPPRATFEYARIARDYAKAVSARSPRPVTDIARKLGLSVTTVRGMVHRARSLGYLTKSSGQGQRGGILTETGQAALKGARTLSAG